MKNKIYNNSKYTTWYYRIITYAQSQQRIKGRGEYYESHHIIPKSIGRDNNSNNLVLLTAKEHYMCHLLLPKMCINSNHKSKMVYAFIHMSAGNQYNKELRYTSNLYEKHKINYAKLISGKNSYMYGVSKTDEIKQKISQTRIKNKTAAGENNPMYGKKHTLAAKQKLSSAKRGKQVGKDNPMYGKKRPDLSERNKQNNVKYRVGQYTKGDQLIAVYDHAKIAAEAIGAKTHRNINHLAKNHSKYPNRTCYGYKWKYI